ncbi:PLD nuclease N-terminal domain-containing protein [Acidimicrobiales bacterium]|nr:PLD nuclease N-terminal domain-containing protein [bacterium]MDC1388502.1 PLD nuclease N-terminal domain-containing protein [Acidimicrobiales bacterium]
MSHMVGMIVPIGIGGLVFFGLWFWSMLDCIATDSNMVRNLPKITWLFVVFLIPTAGALAWLLLGRPGGAGSSVGGNYRTAEHAQRPRSRGFEDSAEWQQLSKQIKAPKPLAPEASESNAVKERRLLEWQAELKKSEAALDDGPPSESGDER